KAQLSELLRLRGEVGPLRRDSQELAKLRAAQHTQKTDPTQPAAARDFVPAAAWANVGADKPEDAMQTFFWAGKHGETNLVGNLLRWQRDAAIPASGELDQKFAESIVSGSVSFAGKTQGYRVVSNIVSQEENRDEARLGVEITGPDGKTESHTLRLVREDNQWFPVMHVWLEGENNIRAALDIPAKFQR